MGFRLLGLRGSITRNKNYLTNDLSVRPNTKLYGIEYKELVRIYFNDIFVCYHNPKATMDDLALKYQHKEGKVLGANQVLRCNYFQEFLGSNQNQAAQSDRLLGYAG
jgi:hypothetical protein